MTWASGTLGSRISQTGNFVRRRLWIWPVIAVFVLALTGYTVNRAIESTIEASLASELETLRDVEVAMLTNWLQAQERNAESAANDREIRTLSESLVSLQGVGDAPQTPESLRAEISQRLSPIMHSFFYEGFLLTNRDLQVVAASEEVLIGQTVPGAATRAIEKAIDGTATVSPPFQSVASLKDSIGRTRTGVPTMFVFAPVRDDNFQVIAVLGFRLRPDAEGEFSKLLGLGRIGQSGETYAFGRDGLLLSQSRFDETLILLGLIPDQPGSQSILNVLVRDPGGNITTGYRPSVRRSELPLTHMAAQAVSGKHGVNVAGYRDYRGVPVVGAWTWLDRYDFGVATESDVAEVYRPLTILKRTFWGLMALLGLTSVAIFVFTLIVARLQRKAREAAVEAKQLGQYRLDKKLGEGAMGVVYQASHTMLRRPTAVKLLTTGKVTEKSIARFEREVQITSLLNHPNTIAIYDFGRTPEDVFYYAMEFLDGIDLQELVETHGPLPSGRVIYILRQVCRSLFEAHSMGLIHRDVKPANVMLNKRGAEADVVKVLDFGLVRAFDDEASSDAGFAGTPMYMSPEAIQMPASVDASTDLYAVGAVGYFLLTGRPVFQASSVTEICQMHVSQTPVPPSHVIDAEIDPDLESLILACLEKNRTQRPPTARELDRQLGDCPAATQWGREQAERWWNRRDRGQLAASIIDATRRADGKVVDSSPPATTDNDTSNEPLPTMDEESGQQLPNLPFGIKDRPNRQ